MISMSGGMDLPAAAAQFKRSSVADDVAQAEAERQRVLAEFPLEQWAKLPLERYALGADQTGGVMTYCRLMEFGTPHMGSIKGGSAGKHIMYLHNSGEWRLASPLRGMDHLAAWERLRGDFTAAFEAVQREDFDAVDELETLLYGPALVTKSLAAYFPQHFLPVFSSSHLREFIALLGGTPTRNAPTWRLNRQLRELVLQRPELDGWSPHEVMIFLYGSFDPRPVQRSIWKIAPGEKGRLWDDCRDSGFICVGWDEVGDLGQYQSDVDLKHVLDSHWPGSSGGSLRTARNLLAFRDLEPGDIVVANRGTSQVLAVGEVADGYRFDATRSEYRHLVPVAWDTSYAQDLAEPQNGWRTTFAKVSAHTLAQIRKGRSGGGAPAAGIAATAAASIAPLPAEVKQVIDALDRKGQAILYGPPGTGKTRLALSVALALGGRGEAIDAVDRAAAVTELLGGTERVRLVTFHPSYGYEDFVEGFKPDLAAAGPGLTLALSDGLFYSLCTAAEEAPERTFLLIIDEINRGDLPRIFGELITLLEIDKRGIPVSLPISKRSFSVPCNVRIIGTMNTADRSVSHLDAAIRRRFAFVPVGPDAEAVSGSAGPLDLASFFEALNTRITRHLDADHQIGHAYFLKDGAPLATEDELAAAFYHDIVPLLEDHCLGRAELLYRILGRLVDEETGSPVRMTAQDLAAALAAEFIMTGNTSSDA